MSSQVVVGTQWGDEGKGKIVDVLAEKADMIVRFPVFRGLHHECLEAILRKSWDSPVFIVVFCALNLFYFFYLFGIIMV